MSRKLLSIIVAVVFVLTTMGTAFAAAVPSDVAGTDFTKAVTKMQGLGIMSGDPDGKFRPNDTIKRSEFAKIAVIAAGMGDAAALSASTTQFSDVPADHWAAGYINVASGAGFIKGFAGKFRPDDTISYSEAITIICRMLGYGPVLDSKPWPQTYFAKGAEIGVTNGVVTTATLGAKRGDVAKLVNNSLTIRKLIVNNWDLDGKPTYKVSDNASDTIIEQNLRCEAITGAGGSSDYTLVVTNAPAVRNNNDTNKADLDGTSYEFVSALNPDNYLGMEVKAWKKKSGTTDEGKVVAVEIQTDAAKIYEGVVSRDDNGKIKLEGISKVLEQLDSAAKLYVNGTPAAASPTLGTITETTLDGGTNKAYGRVIFDGVKCMNAYLWVQAGNNTANSMGADVVGGGITSNTFVLKEINADGFMAGQKSYNDGDAFLDSEKFADYKDDITKATKRIEVLKNNAVATLDDIKPGDVVTKIINGTHITFIVTNNEVKGTLTSVSGGDKKMTLNVGSKGYTIAKGASMTFNNDAYNKIFSSINEIIGKDVTLKLNQAGQVFGLVSAGGTKSYYYGILTDTANGAYGYRTVLKPDGTKVSYSLEDNTNTMPAVGDMVQYRLTSDGKIADDSMVTCGYAYDANDFDYGINNVGAVQVVTPTSNTITVNGDVYQIADGTTVIFDVTSTSDAKVVNYSAIKDKGFTSGNFKFVRDGLKVKYVAVASTLVSAKLSGILVGRGYDADGMTLTFNEKGALKTYKVALSNSFTADNVNALYVDKTWNEYNTNSSGKITAGPTKAMDYNYQVTTAGQLFKVTGVIGTDQLSVKAVTTTGGSLTTYTTEGFVILDSADIYDATNTDDPVSTNVKGGLASSAIKTDDYIWVNQPLFTPTSATVGTFADPTLTANKVTVVVRVKRGNIKGS